MSRMGYEVTIGIPVYRAVEYIGETMKSALNQTFPDIEFLVVDDCGGDGSIQVVEQLQAEHKRGKDIHIIYNTQNCGVGAARNLIIEKACGRYLYFLDSDDLIEPDAIQRLIDKARNYQAEVVYGSLDRIDMINRTPPQASILPDSCFFSHGEMAFYAFRHFNGFQISVCNCLMSLDFLRTRQLRFINTLFWEDFAFTYDLVVEVSRAVLMSDITYHYLCRPESLSHYQRNGQIEKKEILRNISTINYMKRQSRQSIGKDYLPYLCRNLEVTSFYNACFIQRNSHRIVPGFTSTEMQQQFLHPYTLGEILKFRKLLLPNIFYWSLGCMPRPLFFLLFRLLGKLKKAI